MDQVCNSIRLRKRYQTRTFNSLVRIISENPRSIGLNFCEVSPSCKIMDSVSIQKTRTCLTMDLLSCLYLGNFLGGVREIFLHRSNCICGAHLLVIRVQIVLPGAHDVVLPVVPKQLVDSLDPVAEVVPV